MHIHNKHGDPAMREPAKPPYAAFAWVVCERAAPGSELGGQSADRFLFSTFSGHADGERRGLGREAVVAVGRALIDTEPRRSPAGMHRDFFKKNQNRARRVRDGQRARRDLPRQARVLAAGGPRRPRREPCRGGAARDARGGRAPPFFFGCTSELAGGDRRGACAAGACASSRTSRRCPRIRCSPSLHSVGMLRKNVPRSGRHRCRGTL